MVEKVTDNTDETCARKTLGPWLAGTAVLICAAIALAFYHAEDIQKARKERGPMQIGGLQSPFRSRGGRMQATPAQPPVRQTMFVPPWHGKQNPDSVTAATPKRMSFNWAIGIVSPSIVGINTSGAHQQGASGIIVHHLGYILTNNHVVEGAKSISVTLVYDQLIKSYPGELIEARPDLDLALIKLTSTGGEVLTPVPLGDSDKVSAGQDVVAIGNPFGLSQSASAGIVSNTRRSITAGEKVFKDLIQTDASINPGSSGGALVNTKAEVIGVSTAIYSPVQGFTGIAFAIPINQAKAAFPDYIETVRSPMVQSNAQAPKRVIYRRGSPPKLQMTAGPVRTRRVRRCWLGVDINPLDSVVAREFDIPFHHGMLVNRVFINSPADRAGLQRGDVVYRINNRRIKNAQMSWSFLADGKPGDDVKITVFRKGSKKSFFLTLEPEPVNIRALLSKEPQGLAIGAAGEQGIEEISWLGIDIQPVEAGEAMREFGIDPGKSGVFVGEVEGIAAIEAGLLPGDLIKKVNNQQVKDITVFKEIVKTIDPSEGVILDIVRQNRPFYITIRAGRRDLGAWQ